MGLDHGVGYFVEMTTEKTAPSVRSASCLQGRRLWHACPHEAWARRHGLKEIASDLQIANAVTIQAHKVLGYEEVERLVCFRKALDASGSLQDDSDASAPTTLQREEEAHAPLP